MALEVIESEKYLKTIPMFGLISECLNHTDRFTGAVTGLFE